MASSVGVNKRSGRGGGLRRLLSLKKPGDRPATPSGGKKKGFLAFLSLGGCGRNSSLPSSSSPVRLSRDSEREVSHRVGRPPAFVASPPPPATPPLPLYRSNPARLHRRYGYHHLIEFEEVITSRIFLGGMNGHDRFKDWRLDIDNMSYEELLELGDKIGYVSTGLEEEEISHNLSKMKHSTFDASPLPFATEMGCKCSICQEEYEFNDEKGKLNCGHSYHLDCIKEWLLRKNVCPVCKTVVTRT